MKVSMLKVVTLACAASATQAALLCTTDAFCKDVNSTKPYCIYTAAADSECKAALTAAGTGDANNCFAVTSATALQCAEGSQCPSVTGKCTLKLDIGTAAVGADAALKKLSCKTGQFASGTGNCASAATNDAECALEDAAKPFLRTPSSGGTAVCAAGFAAGPTCYLKSTATANQCIATHYCPSDGGACTEKIATGTAWVGDAVSCKTGVADGTVATNCGVGTTDASCLLSSSTPPKPYYVQTAQGTGACQADLIATDAACFPLAGTIQCKATDECIAVSASAFKCKTKATSDATCKTNSADYMPFFVKAAAITTSACQVAGIANNAACFLKTTDDANQCVVTDYCPATSDAATNKCKAKEATLATCEGDWQCASGKCEGTKCKIKNAAACTTKTTATSNQCVTGSYCPATSADATNKCATVKAGTTACTDGFECQSGTCTASKCAATLSPTPPPTAATKSPSKAPSKAPTKADHSDASAITASAFVVASTVFASSVFA